MATFHQVDRDGILEELDKLLGALRYLVGEVEVIGDELPLWATQANAEFMKAQEITPQNRWRTDANGEINFGPVPPQPLYRSPFEYFQFQIEERWKIVLDSQARLAYLLRTGNVAELECTYDERLCFREIWESLQQLPPAPPTLDLTRPHQQVAFEWANKTGMATVKAVQFAYESLKLVLSQNTAPDAASVEVEQLASQDPSGHPDIPHWDGATLSFGGEAVEIGRRSNPIASILDSFEGSNWASVVASPIKNDTGQARLTAVYKLNGKQKLVRFSSVGGGNISWKPLSKNATD